MVTQHMCSLWCVQAKQQIEELRKKVIEAEHSMVFVEQQVKSLQAVSGHAPLQIRCMTSPV